LIAVKKNGIIFKDVKLQMKGGFYMSFFRTLLLVFGIIIFLLPCGVFAQSTALDDSAITPPNTPVTINVVANDTPGSGTWNLAIIANTAPSNGTVVNNFDGTFIYTPSLNFSSPDPNTFNYTVCDTGTPTPSCATATVSIIVAIEVPLNVIPRKLNVKKNGVLPVEIRSEDGFDVTTIDPTTLTLEGVGPLRYNMGKKKLTLKFSANDIVSNIGPVNDRDVVVLQLTGLDINGFAIIGEDPVIIINKDKEKGKPKK